MNLGWEELQLELGLERFGLESSWKVGFGIGLCFGKHFLDLGLVLALGFRER